MALLALAGVVAYAGYYFFIRQDPVHDGREAADQACNCRVTYFDELGAAADEFVTQFEASKFTRRSDASARWSAMSGVVSAAQESCTAESSRDTSTLRGRYLDSPKDSSAFDAALAAQVDVCTTPSEPITQNRIGEVWRLIESIRDPEPTADQIKADLIGKEMLGWRFDFLTEFTGFEVVETTRAGNRVEYRLKLALTGTRSSHEAEAVAAYQLAQGWAFDSVRALSITWDNEIAHTEWVRVVPLENATWTASDEFRLAWKAHEYAREVNTGPDVPDATLPSSSSYLVKSREGRPVTLRMTYRPR